MRKDPTFKAAVGSDTDRTASDEHLSAVLNAYRRATKKSDQYLLVKAQLLTPAERKAAIDASRKAWS